MNFSRFCAASSTSSSTPCSVGSKINNDDYVHEQQNLKHIFHYTYDYTTKSMLYKRRLTAADAVCERKK